MYIPAPFAVSDNAKLVAMIEQHSFATVVTINEGVPFASHVPLLYSPKHGTPGALRGHLAWANPQWRHFAPDRQALVVFQGPHAYVSPSWYRSTLVVPTWNYVAIHVYGVARLMESDEELEQLLEATITRYESGMPNPWRGDLPPEFKGKMIKGIVGFEISIQRLEGKLKMGQNRAPEDVAAAIDVLSRSDEPMDRAVASLMKEANAQRV